MNAGWSLLVWGSLWLPWPPGLEVAHRHLWLPLQVARNDLHLTVASFLWFVTCWPRDFLRLIYYFFNSFLGLTQQSLLTMCSSNSPSLSLVFRVHKIWFNSMECYATPWPLWRDSRILWHIVELSFAFEGLPLSLSLPHLSLFSVLKEGECLHNLSLCAPFCSAWKRVWEE